MTAEQRKTSHRSGRKIRTLATMGSVLRRKRAIYHSADNEVVVAIVRMPEPYVGKVEGVAVVVSEGTSKPVGEIDEETREAFRTIGEGYDELCDRLFADDPVFSYRTAEDRTPQ